MDPAWSPDHPFKACWGFSHMGTHCQKIITGFLVPLLHHSDEALSHVRALWIVDSKLTWEVKPPGIRWTEVTHGHISPRPMVSSLV